MLTPGAGASLPRLPHLLHQRLGWPWALAPPRTKSLPVQGDGISRVAHLPPKTGHVGAPGLGMWTAPGPREARHHHRHLQGCPYTFTAPPNGA